MLAWLLIRLLIGLDLRGNIENVEVEGTEEEEKANSLTHSTHLLTHTLS